MVDSLWLFWEEIQLHGVNGWLGVCQRGAIIDLFYFSEAFCVSSLYILQDIILQFFFYIVFLVRLVEDSWGSIIFGWLGLGTVATVSLLPFDWDVFRGEHFLGGVQLANASERAPASVNWPYRGLRCCRFFCHRSLELEVYLSGNHTLKKCVR